MENFFSSISGLKYGNEIILIMALILILGAWKFVVERD